MSTLQSAMAAAGVVGRSSYAPAAPHLHVHELSARSLSSSSAPSAFPSSSTTSTAAGGGRQGGVCPRCALSQGWLVPSFRGSGKLRAPAHSLAAILSPLNKFCVVSLSPTGRRSAAWESEPSPSTSVGGGAAAAAAAKGQLETKEPKPKKKGGASGKVSETTTKRQGLADVSTSDPEGKGVKKRGRRKKQERGRDGIADIARGSEEREEERVIALEVDNRGERGGEESETGAAMEGGDGDSAVIATEGRGQEAMAGDVQARGEERSDGEGKEDEEVMIGNLKMTAVCDRLLVVFLIEKTDPEDWRKLLAFSDEWQNIRPHFYKRCKVKAAQEEDIEKKTSYLRLARRLEKVEEDMQRHYELLREIEKNEDNLDALILRRRKDFTSDFFKHLKLVSESYYEEPLKQDEMTSLAAKVLSAVENHDRMEADRGAMAAAQEKFDDILNSPNLDIATAKIDDLASRKQLDPALMMLITKAWVAAKESNMMKEEVKDIMHHLYMRARGNMHRFLPTEVRIMRHLLTIEDPRERMAAMTEAFCPGDELEGEKIDMLYTTPQRLHRYVSAVLGAFEHPRNNPLFVAAKDMMKPMVIQRLMIMKEMLEDQFL